ncbi:MAG TPA: chemotaxis protein CheW [Gammaproteobacteria bacterium]|nr:chemotaxis protein CheW [Gammaproteobacteria bacterium]
MEYAEDSTVEEVHDPLTQWVTFFLENEKYGVPVSQVMEVLRFTEITPVPGAPDSVMGIINLRGNVVTVLDTRKKFGLPPKETDDSTRIVVINIEDDVIGILVDNVSDVMWLRASEMDSAPNTSGEENARYIQGVASRDGELLILVDLLKLFAEEEWK